MPFCFSRGLFEHLPRNRITLLGSAFQLAGDGFAGHPFATISFSAAHHHRRQHN
jgi:hypothetical protein